MATIMSTQRPLLGAPTRPLARSVAIRSAAAARPRTAIAVAAAVGTKSTPVAPTPAARATLPRSLLAPPPRAAGAESGGDDNGSGSGSGSTLISGALLAMWAGLLGYVFLLSPNQTPTIDAFVVQKLVGLKADDPFVVNAVFAAVFNAMGLYPLIYAALLIPAARSDRLPAWPFVMASVFLGAYALLPYMALWTPKSDPPQQLPPPKEELDGWSRLYMRGAETAVLPALLLAGAGYYLYSAATAGGQAWLDYVRLFDQSRLVHATSIDFALCTLLAPFWMANDAEGRQWEQRGTLLPVLSFLPLVGPAVYLLLRPKTKA